MFEYFLKSLENEGPHIPVIIDEDSALECIGRMTNNHIVSLDECKTGSIPNVFLYEKMEDKKHLSIVDARRCIEDISIQPYEGKAFYILRDFDEATPEAMNALLKTLEEPPSYAVILLIVTNPENIIETIHSRSRTLFQKRTRSTLSPEIKTMIYQYFMEGNIGLVRLLHEGRYEGEGAQEILRESARYATMPLLHKIEESLIHLFQVNENPKNILDRVFLCKTNSTIYQ